MRRAPLVARAVAGLVAAGLLVAGCGGGGGEEKKPVAAPDDVATDIAPPKPTSAQTFAGQSLSENDTKRLTATMTAALRSGNKKQFLGVFDPSRTELIAQQGTWFDNVRKVPMKTRKIVLVKARDTRDSTGKGQLLADMGFVHQISGADAKPLAEWYSFNFRKAGSKLLVTGVKGAAADESSGVKFSRYYRQPWDDAAMTVVQGRRSIILGPAADEGAMRGLLGKLDDAVSTQVTRFARNGVKLTPDQRTRKWVFMLQSPQVPDVFDYLGGLVKQREADFAAFVSAQFTSDPVLGYLDTDQPPLTSRIVLDRSIFSSDPAATIRHEMVHALEDTWAVGHSQAPTWAVEGTAVALSDVPSSERSYRMSAGLRYLRAHSGLPSDDEFYEGGNTSVSEHYGAGFVAAAYLADKRGEKGLLDVLRAMDQPDADVEKILGMSEKKLAKEALAWAS